MNATTDLFDAKVRKTAVLSECGTYRYRLGRLWSASLPACGWVMLNPSTADEREDDPTVRRCVGFARSWGCGSVVVVNLFALRSTDPDVLDRHPDPVGPCNDRHTVEALRACGLVVAGWGSLGRTRGRDRQVLDLLAGAGVGLYALGTTREGQPRHPLYLRADQIPTPYPGDARG